MKKVLLVLCLLFPLTKIFAQQFSQYNTGTLYDSFENPSQRAFVTDSSNKYASNFLVPNLNANFFFSGDAQSSLKQRAFLNKYDNSSLVINQGRYNMANLNANVYLAMFKTFVSFNGDEEMGFSWQMKAEGNGLFTDDTFGAFSGASGIFANGSAYNNIFNDNFYYQTYHQISFTYREKFDKFFSFGFKFSGLLGIQYQKLDINSSTATFNSAKDQVTLDMAGVYHQSYVPGRFITRDYLPTFRNPGAAISIGGTYRTEDAYIIQGNIKDLGFIHWSGRSHIYDFNDVQKIQGLSTPVREDSIYNKVYKLIHNSPVGGPFTTPIDGRAELSVNHSYWIDDDHDFKYSPTLVASKELFAPGFTGAFVNSVQYQKYSLALTPSYDDLKIFNLGAQFMMKTPNWEFYIGSDRLMQTINLASDAIGKNPATVMQNNPYTGLSFFMGFSLKFGPPVEHPMNASIIPTGEKGFLARLWGRLFKTYN